MQTGSGTKNPPWARSNVNSSMTGMNPQIMDPNSMMSQQGMMPFQQTQAVFNPSMMQAQGGMAMPMGGQMQMNQMAQGQMYPGNVVAYPTPRAMNSNMYQNTQSNQASSNSEQRVFTGTVTKTHNDFGFVDHDVFYQASVCAKGIIPKVNDRVLVEASYNPNMPFKWNATRVQVLPKGGPNQNKNNPKSNNYNAVPPPSKGNKSMPPRREDRGGPRHDSMRRDNIREDRKRSRTRSRSRSRDRRDSRNRRDSPPRKRPVIHQPSPAKYVVRVPRMPLDIQKMDVPGLSQRYNNLYIPSDFFAAHVKWGETFPPQMPFSINNPCSYHIMSREVENPNPNDAILEPPDSDYRFSAKVMLISMPTLESLYQKCGLTKTDEKDKRPSSKSPLHPTRLIKFLVGQKGKGGENFAIGGPWSPSLDGENPDTDPSVLVRTAIRTCKALTGVDLSACTQWYRMVEFYYWREGSGGKSRLECVVLYLPDVWSAQPSRVEWTTIQDHYKAACEAALKKLDGADRPAQQPQQQQQQQAPAPNADSSTDGDADKSQIENQDGNDSTITIDENDEEVAKMDPTHYSKLDLKTIKVEQLRQELRARKVNCKGVRSTLVSRLSKLLKSEEENENQKTEDVMEVEDEDKPSEEQKDEEAEDDEPEEKPREDDKQEKPEDKKDAKEKEADKKPKEKTEKEIEEEKKKKEKERAALKTRYELPGEPHIIVHPNSAAKGGKFACSVATLSLMLDYRVTDNKEHSFELFVFAELFNEMLMRDFGFYIYKTLYTLPEKAEEVKEVKEKEKSTEKKEGDKKDEKKPEGDKAEKKEPEKDKKDDKEKEGEKKKDEKDVKEKKDDKRDDRRESRRRGDRRESHSGSERGASPRRRGAGGAAGAGGGGAGGGAGGAAGGRGVELPPDPYLLLSLVYFDTGRGGVVSKKDLQNLFMSLGLQLSRSQIKNILEKVCQRENFSYKALMQAIKDLASGTSDSIQDLPLDSTVNAAGTEVPPQIAELEATIAAGNRELLPVFNRPREDGTKSSQTKDVSDSGLVVYKSRLVDVGSLVAAEARSAAHRARLQDALSNTRAALGAARQAAASTLAAERGAQHQLSDVSTNLLAARDRIASLTASSKIFHSALKSIQAKVEAVVNIKYEDDDVVEVVSNGPTKGKDSKGVKSEVKEEANETKKEVKEEKEQKIKEPDNVATENMDLDDKE